MNGCSVRDDGRPGPCGFESADHSLGPKNDNGIRPWICPMNDDERAAL